MKRFALLALAALTLAGCASEPPPVSERVQQYYNENVVNRPTEAPKMAVPSVAVVGDSYSAGASNTVLWHQVIARTLPAKVTDVSLGGAGYAVPGRDFAAQVQKLPATSDLVIVAGSRNDQDAPGNVGPAARSLYAAIKAKAPAAKIVVIGPIWDSSKPSAGAVSANEEVRAAAKEAKLPFIDALAENWLSDPDLIQKVDGVHATDNGEKVLAERIRQHLVKLGY